MYYLGVDGGGTKTSFAIIDKNGNLLGKAKTTTCHHGQVGFNGLEDILNQGIAESCRMAGITPKSLTYSYLGIPGYGENKAEQEEIEIRIGNILGRGSFQCGNDVEAGWAGSLACEPGISVIAGTGAISFGKNAQGETARSSGWGHYCGDEGSAHWIGKKAIEVFSKQADGRIDKSELYNIVRTRFDLEADFDLIQIVISELQMDRGKIAQISRLVHEAAEKGDRSAQKIFQEAAEEIYLMIEAVYNKISFDGLESCSDESVDNEDADESSKESIKELSKESAKVSKKIPLSYAGGVFNAGKYILNPLKEKLQERLPRLEMMAPVFEPVIGSALNALIIHGKKNDDKRQKLDIATVVRRLKVQMPTKNEYCE